ncbi:hypothetical protein TNCV_4980551 [Trichonephila clavipes]|nr:hypothetical protein TNCV_4980551 [Trichonephila clavipes]
MNDRLCNSHRSFALQSALSWPTLCTSRAGWLAAAGCFECQISGTESISGFGITPPPTMEPNKGAARRSLTCVRRGFTSGGGTGPIDRSGLTPASVYGEAWARGATGTPDSTFPVRVAAHGKHAGQTKKPVLTFRI